jgi:hypothetical protein
MVIVKVNEERVQLDALADGDVIQVGVHSLRFHSAVLDPANEPVADGAMKSGRWPSRK